MIKVSVIHTGKVYVSPALPFQIPCNFRCCHCTGAETEFGCRFQLILTVKNLFCFLQMAATLKNRGVKKFRPVLPLMKIWR